MSLSLFVMACGSDADPSGGADASIPIDATIPPTFDAEPPDLAPVVRVDFPAPMSQTAKSCMPLRIHVSDEREVVSVTLSGVQIASTTGALDKELTLASGENVFVVEATDSDRQTTAQTVTRSRDSEPICQQVRCRDQQNLLRRHRHSGDRLGTHTQYANSPR